MVDIQKVGFISARRTQVAVENNSMTLQQAIARVIVIISVTLNGVRVGFNRFRLAE
jgi:hypothetical protein